MQTQQFQDAMTEATRLTRAGRLTDATALIQRALGHSGGGADGHPGSGTGEAAGLLDIGRAMDAVAIALLALATAGWVWRRRRV